MRENIKYLILNFSIWRLFISIWKLWSHLLEKIYPNYLVEEMDEFNKFGYYFIKYLGIPLIIFVITFLFSFTDLWQLTSKSQQILNEIKEFQHNKW